MIKQYGTHLKASAAMVRLRLYDVLSQLPPESFEGTCQISVILRNHFISCWSIFSDFQFSTDLWGHNFVDFLSLNNILF